MSELNKPYLKLPDYKDKYNKKTKKRGYSKKNSLYGSAYF